ncbi:hypothetical protein Cal7507_2568 [Calothrix sp. PCC 7507]|nr:hypothetical protein Cal7507_2568 [Calothrix sp. PCC 7507]
MTTQILHEFLSPKKAQSQHPSTARRKSKVKSQKSKELYSKLLRHLKWYVYLRRAVLVVCQFCFEGFLVVRAEKPA